MMNKTQQKKKTTWVPKRRRKCQFCVDRGKEINYKDVDLLRRYISERGKILNRRVTKSCAKHQRVLNKAIKEARNLALLPYTVE